MKTYTITNKDGYSEQLDAGTTKPEAEAVLAALGEGWTLTASASGPTVPKARTSYTKGNKHGFWPVRARVPREESLQRVLISESRVRLDHKPVVTYDLNPADRPV